MNGGSAEMVGNFFAGNKKELSRAFKTPAKLLERFEARFWIAIHFADFDPVVPKLFAILFEGNHGGVIGRDAHPFVSRQHHVMVRKSEKIVSVFLVPVDDHLWKVVAIAPQ